MKTKIKYRVINNNTQKYVGLFFNYYDIPKEIRDSSENNSSYSIHKLHKPIEVRVCEKCGCHDLHACLGGCYWISDHFDICSKCYNKLSKTVKEALIKHSC